MSDHITNSEQEILAILWNKGPSTTREIHEEIALTKEVGYTSTLKTIQNMYEKELLSREPKGKTHIYQSKVEKEVVQKRLLGGFMNRIFNGSSKNLILQALGNQKPTKDELAEIRDLISKLEDEQ